MNKVHACIVGLALFLGGCGSAATVEESSQSAVYRNIYYSYTFGYNWSCVAGSAATFQWYGSYVKIAPRVWSGPDAGATWAITLTASNSDNLSLKVGEMPLYEAMDGPYHVLYNIAPTGAGMEVSPAIYGFDQRSPDGLWNAHPVQIPAYGIWVYAANERADYPRGAMVLTVDPLNNPYAVAYPDGWSGRCSSRRQFVIGL